MLIAEPTRYGAGLALYGDYWDLRDLHQTVHTLIDGAPFAESMKDAIVGLAYDIRHAYQRDREERIFGFDEHDKVTYCGVKILWPELLFEANALRWACAFQPSTKAHQSNLFRLENCIENALVEYDAVIGQQCAEWLKTPFLAGDDYLPMVVGELSYRYIFAGPLGKSRFRRLPDILRCLHPSSTDYREFEAHMKAIAQKQGCSPLALHDMTEWPTFKW